MPDAQRVEPVFRGEAEGADVIHRLPDAAARHLRRLRELRDALHAEYVVVQQHVDDALHVFRRAKQHFDEIDRAADAGNLTKSREEIQTKPDGTTARVLIRELDVARLERERETLRRAEADLEHQRDRRHAVEFRWSEAAALVRRCEEWAAKQRRFIEAGIHAPKLKAGVGPAQAVEDLRIDLCHLESDLERVKNAPRLIAEMKEDARREVDALTARGTPDVAALLEPGGRIFWPTTRVEIGTFNAAGDAQHGGCSVVDTAALLAWLSGDVLLAKVEAAIDALADPTNALSAADRAHDIAEIHKDMVLLQRREEALIRLVEQSHGTLQRRGDMHPAACLALRDLTIQEG
jgi:hypothetical protein